MVQTINSILETLHLFRTGRGQEIAFITLNPDCFQALRDEHQMTSNQPFSDFRTIGGVPFVVNSHQTKAVQFELKDGRS